jgi:hypothetical protein
MTSAGASILSSSLSGSNRSTLAVVVGAAVVGVGLAVVDMVFMRPATVLVPFFAWSL